jgi:hypothetical protein
MTHITSNDAIYETPEVLTASYYSRGFFDTLVLRRFSGG